MKMVTSLISLIIVFVSISTANANLYFEPTQIASKYLVIIYDKQKQEKGTGILVGSTEQFAWYVTAYHVVRDADISVKYSHCDFRNSVVVAYDERIDIAVVRTQREGPKLPSGVHKDWCGYPDPIHAPIILFSGRTALQDCDQKESVMVLGFPLGKETIRQLSTSILNIKIQGKDFAAEIGGKFISSGISGGIVLNTNNEWIGMATEVHSTSRGEIGGMVNYGAIEKFLINNNIQINEVKRHFIVDRWTLIAVSARNDVFQKISASKSLDFHENGEVTGLVNGRYCIKARNKLTINDDSFGGGGETIYIPSTVDDSSSRFKFSQMSSCLVFNADQTKTLVLKCKPEFFDSEYTLKFSGTKEITPIIWGQTPTRIN